MNEKIKLDIATYTDGLISLDDCVTHIIETARSDIEPPLQYKIDQLMLEYCPNEMSKEQMDNWKKNQVKATISRQ